MGQPTESPAQLGLGDILQFMENFRLTEKLPTLFAHWIDWKYLLEAHELTDPRLSPSVLSEFRQRLLEQEAEKPLVGSDTGSSVRPQVC